MNPFYVYAYLDPRKPGKFKYGEYEFSHEPFYIGKGTKSRINRHLAGNGGFNPIKKNKINKIIQSGQNPILIKIKEKLTNQEAIDLEIELIRLIGRITRKSGPLTNFTKGGETYLGYKHKQDYIDKLNKPVVLYDKNGKLIEEYKSVKEAGLKNNIQPQTISQICNGDIKIYKNKYIFLYKDEEFNPRIRQKKEYPVLRIDYKNEIVEYESVTQASIDSKCNLSKICEVCKGQRFQTGGFLWRYKRHPKLEQFNYTIEKNFGKYLRLMDKKITDGDKTYCNLLHVVSVNKNSKINNIFNLLDSNKIYKFYELHTI